MNGPQVRARNLTARVFRGADLVTVITPRDTRVHAYATDAGGYRVTPCAEHPHGKTFDTVDELRKALQ